MRTRGEGKKRLGKCKVCKEPFEKFSMAHKICGKPECRDRFIEAQTLLSAKKRDLADRKATRERKEKLKTRQEWANDAQFAFNAYIRSRDSGQPCISCGKLTGCKMNAGHYLSRGARPELRYEPLNCHLQCEKCNSWLSGNVVAYRINLIKKIGIDKVEWLEGPHAPKKYTIDDLKAIKAEYTAKRKDIEKNKPAGAG